VRQSQRGGDSRRLPEGMVHHVCCRLLTPHCQRQPAITHRRDAQTLLIMAMCRLCMGSTRSEAEEDARRSSVSGAPA
jgi:hypothetical protein